MTALCLKPYCNLLSLKGCCSVPTALAPLHIALASVKDVHFSLHVSQLFPTVHIVFQSCASTRYPLDQLTVYSTAPHRRSEPEATRLFASAREGVWSAGARERVFLMEVAVQRGWGRSEWRLLVPLSFLLLLSACAPVEHPTMSSLLPPSSSFLPSESTILQSSLPSLSPPQNLLILLLTYCAPSLPLFFPTILLCSSRSPLSFTTPTPTCTPPPPLLPSPRSSAPPTSPISTAEPPPLLSPPPHTSSQTQPDSYRPQTVASETTGFRAGQPINTLSHAVMHVLQTGALARNFAPGTPAAAAARSTQPHKLTCFIIMKILKED